MLCFTQVKNPVTGQWGLQKEVMVGRLIFAGGTNSVGNLSDAFLSRTTVLALTAGNSNTHQAQRAHTSLNVAVSTDPEKLKKRRAFVLSSRLAFSFSVRFWSLHAIGVIPSISTLLFTIFTGVLSKYFPSLDLPPRKIADLRTLTEGICIFDRTTTWSSGGLGKQFEFDSAVESIWYASSAFVTAEHVCSAFQILDQGNTTAAQLQEVRFGLCARVLFYF